jgi:hypothetical protein
VPDFKETTRDTHTFSRRVGTLPEQRDGDELDFRPLLHRLETVITVMTCYCVCAASLAVPSNGLTC